MKSLGITVIGLGKMGKKHLESINSLENCHIAALSGRPPLIPGEEGIRSVELGNAILYSLIRRREVSLPLDSSAYQALLSELIASSKKESY